MRASRHNFFLLFSIFIQISCTAQTFFRAPQWNEYINEKGDDLKCIIAISNGNSHCSDISNQHRVIMVLFKTESHWFAEKMTFAKDKLNIIGNSRISIQNSEFLDLNCKYIKENFESLLLINSEITGPFIELYFQDLNSIIEIPYVNAGGRGDINGFLNSEHEIFFKIYSLVNNNCF
jgi:hypothetical protein